jgi:hypothetical protein
VCIEERARKRERERDKAEHDNYCAIIGIGQEEKLKKHHDGLAEKGTLWLRHKNADLFYCRHVPGK